MPIALLAMAGCAMAPPAGTGTTRAASAPAAKSAGLGLALGPDTAAAGDADPARAWGGVWLPTLTIVDAPVLDLWSPLASRQAARQAEAALPAARAAVAKWDAEARARWEARDAALRDRPLALEAWRDGASSGRLTPALAGAFDALAQAGARGGLDATGLVADALAEWAEPARVSQGKKMTCEATALQIMLLRRDPARYLALLAGLAGPEGRAALGGGQTLARCPDWAASPHDLRTTPGRLMQSALALYGNGELGYSNARDENSLGASGLTDAQTARLESTLFGPAVALGPEAAPAARAAALDASLAAGWEAPVWLDWASGHVVLVTGRSGGKYQLDNPFGLRHTMEEAAFRAALHSGYVRAEFARQPALR